MPARRRSVPAAPPGRPIHEPVQDRSRATHDALVDAFRALLAEREFDAIAVVDIGRRAGVSVGGFYARFASKDALLLPLVDDMIDEATALLDGAMNRVERDGGNLRALVDAYVRPMVQWFARNRMVLVQAARAARGQTAAAIGERVTVFNRHVHGRFRAAALARRREITRANPARAIEYSLFFASASAREGTMPGNWATYSVQPRERDLATAIADAWHAYLTTRSA